MKVPLVRFYQFLGEPINSWSRLVLVALVVPLGLSYTQPLWKIHMVAPQYPNGLDLKIYSYKLEGGNKGHDIKEINVLNHYIGMRPIDRAALSDLDWLPFVFGFIGILALRVAAIGDVRALIDLLVLTTYVGLFGLFRFYHKLYSFGHDLDPKAPFKIEPFTPVMFGKKQVANFTTEAYPQLATLYVAIFATGLLVIVLGHLWAGRRRAGAATAVQASPG